MSSVFSRLPIHLAPSQYHSRISAAKVDMPIGGTSFTRNSVVRGSPPNSVTGSNFAVIHEAARQSGEHAAEKSGVQPLLAAVRRVLLFETHFARLRRASRSSAAAWHIRV